MAFKVTPKLRHVVDKFKQQERSAYLKRLYRPYTKARRGYHKRSASGADQIIWR